MSSLSPPHFLLPLLSLYPPTPTAPSPASLPISLQNSWEFYSCLREENVRDISQRSDTIQLRPCRNRPSWWGRNMERGARFQDSVMGGTLAQGSRKDCGPVCQELTTGKVGEAGSVRLWGVATRCPIRIAMGSHQGVWRKWMTFFKN